jgi:HD-like signal output (HDOD) protein
MPDIAVRIRAAMSDEKHDVGSIARILQADAGVAACVVRMANSPLYRGATPSRDVPAAVMRLGMQHTRNVVTAHTLRAMFSVRAPALAGVMEQLWRRSVRLAALSAVLSRRCMVATPDRALLAGLLQDIGALPIVGALARRREEPPGVERVWATVEVLSSRVGVALLRHWEFDEEMVEVARSRDDWLRHSGPGPDLADIVLIARLHACIGTAELQNCPRIDQVPASGKLPLGPLQPDESLLMLAEAETEVREVEQALGV